MSLSARQKSFLIELYKIQEGLRSPAPATPQKIAPPIVPPGWIEYGPTHLPPAYNYDPPLRSALRAKRLIDSGAGAIWKSLEKANLVELRHEVVTVESNNGKTLLTRLTPKGRGLVEVILGIKKKRQRIPQKADRPIDDDLLSFSGWRVLDFLRRHIPQSVPVHGAWGQSPPPTYIMTNILKSLARRGLAQGDVHAASLTPLGLAFYDKTLVRHLEKFPNFKTRQSEP